MKDLERAKSYLELILTDVENLSELTYIDIANFMCDFHEYKLKLLNIANVSGSVLPECNRVEVIDKTGRAYTNYRAKNVETQMQDGGKTLKVFLE